MESVPQIKPCVVLQLKYWKSEVEQHKDVFHTKQTVVIQSEYVRFVVVPIILSNNCRMCPNYQYTEF